LCITKSIPKTYVEIITKLRLSVHHDQLLIEQGISKYT